MFSMIFLGKHVLGRTYVKLSVYLANIPVYLFRFFIERKLEVLDLNLDLVLHYSVNKDASPKA